MPEISIIVPIYKVEAYLRRCLDSVLAQTFHDFEVICVNDGSPDGCDKILTEYADKYDNIRIINQENQGLSMARNNGLKEAHGKYICFLDSDDFLDKDFLLDLYNKAKETDADIVMTSTRYLGHKKSKQDILRRSILTSFAEKILILPHGGCWNKLYKKTFLSAHKLQFPKDLYWEDNLFTIQACYFSNKLAVIDSNSGVYNYVNNPKGITRDLLNEEKRKEDSIVIAQMIMDFVKSQNCNQKETEIISNFCLQHFINTNILYQDDFHYKIKKVLGDSKFLRKQRRKQIFKRIKRKIINSIKFISNHCIMENF